MQAMNKKLLDRYMNPAVHLIYRYYKNLITREDIAFVDEVYDDPVERRGLFLKLARLLYKRFNERNRHYNIAQYAKARGVVVEYSLSESDKCYLKKLDILYGDFLEISKLREYTQIKALLEAIKILDSRINLFSSDELGAELCRILCILTLLENQNWGKLVKKIMTHAQLQNLTKEFYNFVKSKEEKDLILSVFAKKPNLKSIQKQIFKRKKRLQAYHNSLVEGDLPLVKNFLENDPSLLYYSFPTDRMLTPFHIAVRSANTELIDYLLSLDQEGVHYLEKNEMTPLCLAIEKSDRSLIEYLLSKGALINFDSSKKTNALYYSVVQSDPAITKLLIDRGADPNLQNYMGRTPLTKAVYLCKREKTEILLNTPNINIHLQDENGRNALHMACWGNAGGKNGKKLWNEIKGDFPWAMEKLLELNIDIYAKDRNGNNPIHVSCYTNAIDCIKIWKERGVCFNQRNDAGENALLAALLFDTHEAIEYLVEHVDLDFFCKNNKGEDAIDYIINQDLGERSQLAVYNKFVNLKAFDYLIDKMHKLIEKEECLHSLKAILVSNKDFIDYCKTHKPDKLLEFIISKFNQQYVEKYRAFLEEFFSVLDLEKVLKLIYSHSNPDLFLLFTENNLEQVIDVVKNNFSHFISISSPKMFKNHQVFKIFVEHISFPVLLDFRNKLNQNILMLLIQNGNAKAIINFLDRFKMNKEKIPKLQELYTQKDIHDTSVYDYCIKYRMVHLFEMFWDVTDDKTKNKHIFLKCEIEEIEKDDPLVYKELSKPIITDEMIENIQQMAQNEAVKEITDIFLKDKVTTLYNLNYKENGISLRFVMNKPEFDDMMVELGKWKVIGVDMEYQESVYDKEEYKIFTIIQIATPKTVYIIDSFTLYYECKETLKQIFVDKGILKLIFGCYNDLQILHSFLEIRMVNYLDLAIAHQIMVKSKNSIGLATVSKKLLNFELDKDLRVNNWNIRPLPNILAKYAAMDSLVLFPVFYEIFKRTGLDKEFIKKLLLKSEKMYEKMHFKNRIKTVKIVQT